MSPSPIHEGRLRGSVLPRPCAGNFWYYACMRVYEGDGAFIYRRLKFPGLFPILQFFYFYFHFQDIT